MTQITYVNIYCLPYRMLINNAFALCIRCVCCNMMGRQLLGAFSTPSFFLSWGFWNNTLLYNPHVMSPFLSLWFAPGHQTHFAEHFTKCLVQRRAHFTLTFVTLFYKILGFLGFSAVAYNGTCRNTMKEATTSKSLSNKNVSSYMSLS